MLKLKSSLDLHLPSAFFDQFYWLQVQKQTCFAGFIYKIRLHFSTALTTFTPNKTKIYRTAS